MSDVITLAVPSVSASLLQSAEGVTYVSLAPGTYAGAVSVRIRNVTGGITLPTITIIDGGFDPVSVPAAPGDRLELSFAYEDGATRIEVVTVPARRAPAIVRTSPAKGRTDVPLNVRPRIVFTEPVDPLGLAGSIELRQGGALVADQVVLVEGEPWAAELVPDDNLSPGVTYEIIITQGVRDLDGTQLEAPLTIAFTTVPAVTEGGRIAFVSTRDAGTNWSGPPMIYLVNPDGTGLVRLVPGDEPAWSPDGRAIAFQSHATGPAPTAEGEIHLIDADGSNRRMLVGNQAWYPTWSPDGRRVAFIREGNILAVDADGSGETTLIEAETIAGLTGAEMGIHTLAWSPDGFRLAFNATEVGSPGPWRVILANVDGRGLRQLDLGPGGEFGASWSPDGSRLALSLDGRIVSAATDASHLRSHDYGTYTDWAPSGSSLVYSRPPGKLDCWDTGCWDRIFVTDIATGARRQLVPEAVNRINGRYWDYDPVWSRR